MAKHTSFTLNVNDWSVRAVPPSGGVTAARQRQVGDDTLLIELPDSTSAREAREALARIVAESRYSELEDLRADPDEAASLEEVLLAFDRATA